MRQAIYRQITGADPDYINRGEAKNGLKHVSALTLTKTADSLIQPKLVLAWLLTSLSAPGWIIGLLVPIREAGALLPQILLARFVERASKTKYLWTIGSLGQAACAGLIGLTALTFDGVTAGLIIIALLTVFATFRAVCSVSYKDTLARTIPKQRRGSLTGLAASLAAGSVILFGAALSMGLIPLTSQAIAFSIMIAGLFWLSGAILFLRLQEPDSDNDAEDDTTDLEALIAPVLEDQQLQYLIYTRALLAVTALAPPFIVMLSSQSAANTLGSLGPFVLAAALASILSGYVWGRLSDQSSRLTLAVSGSLAGAVYIAIGLASELFGDLAGVIGSMIAMFAAQLAYEGVRAGRKLHLTDMVGDDRRARYTAISNTLIGAALVAGGLFGVIAETVGTTAVFYLFTAAAWLGALLAFWKLKEVQ